MTQAQNADAIVIKAFSEIPTFPGTRVTVMEQVGHFPMSENPEQFRRDIAPVFFEIQKAHASPKQGVHA